MELWDIYDADKKPTGRTMKRNDWCLKNGEYHLTVLGVVARPDGEFLITKRVILVKQYQKLFAIDGVTLTFTEGPII